MSTECQLRGRGGGEIYALTIGSDEWLTVTVWLSLDRDPWGGVSTLTTGEGGWPYIHDCLGLARQLWGGGRGRGECTLSMSGGGMCTLTISGTGLGMREKFNDPSFQIRVL